MGALALAGDGKAKVRGRRRWGKAEEGVGEALDIRMCLYFGLSFGFDFWGVACHSAVLHLP